jgi:hypothetical protein
MYIVQIVVNFTYRGGEDNDNDDIKHKIKGSYILVLSKTETSFHM